MYKNNAKIGFVGFTYPAPKELSTLDKAYWQMKAAKEMGCGVFVPSPFGVSPEDMNKIYEKMAEYGFETEGRLSPSAFELVGWQGADPVKAREVFEQSLVDAKARGLKILRGAWGRLKAQTTRWNTTPGWTGAEQKANLIASLKVAAPLLEKYGLYGALENHLDFTGKEFDEIYTAVGSKHVGCAYDTANGFFTNTDPNEDIDYMSKWAITTHIKDTKIIDSCFGGANGPLVPVGCILGQGNVDVKRALDTILAVSPMRDGIHLIIETGWFGKEVQDANPDMDAYNHMITIESMKYLKNYLTI
ncbi:MAG: sugar phosphate isomerase/epimerase [Clostridia bacterium]|nr:sugar phosphate isomerase/epimerase [Clostridia bacterium]